MSATVLIRTIDDFWGLIQASSTTSAWYYFRERISIDTALQYLRDRGLSPDWSSGAEVCEALFRAAQGLTAAKLSRKLKGAIKRNTLAQILEASARPRVPRRLHLVRRPHGLVRRP
ncbi:MAG: hypothetical protein IPK80_28590 [Nannocystis sp.]|nr:hypothetical protein [Nannocystis sp.]